MNRTAVALEYKFRVAAFFWASALLYFWTIPTGEMVPNSIWQRYPILDKIVHMLAFGILFWLTAKAVGESGNKVKISMILIMVIVYSAILEGFQIFLEHRSFDFADIIANIMGALAAMYIVHHQ